MMPQALTGGQVLAIELGRRRLRAVLARRSRSGLAIERTLSEAVPAGLQGADSAPLGEWAAQRLQSAGLPRVRAIMALPRESFVLKRVQLPTDAAEELPGMTRLAVQRDLPLAPEATVIDFVPVKQDSGGTTVMAVALERKKLDAAESFSAAAGLKLERISLRCMGCAALLGSRGEDDSGGVLAIDVAGDAVEFSVIVGGSLRFSRSADLSEADDPITVAEAVITETRRTWLSFRASEDADPVGSVVVLGERLVAQRVAEAVREIVQLPSSILQHHPLVRGDDGAVGEFGSLAGLLLEPIIKAPLIDLTRPRQPADRAAQRRQYMLAGIALAIVAYGVAWTIGHREFARLQEREQDLKAKAEGALPEYYQFLRDQDRLHHLQQWEQIRVDWLAHAARLYQSAPQTGEVVFESWNGTLNTLGVQWDSAADRWSAPMEVRINIDGEAKNRAAADRMRNALVEDETYSTTSQGVEATSGRRLPHSFSFQLKTARPLPDARPPAPPPEEKAGGGA